MEEQNTDADNEDDSHWKLGIFYFNPNDKRLFLPKRRRPGWTVNCGNPYIIAISVFLIAVYTIYIIHMIRSLR